MIGKENLSSLESFSRHKTDMLILRNHYSSLLCTKSQSQIDSFQIAGTM